MFESVIIIIATGCFFNRGTGEFFYHYLTGIILSLTLRFKGDTQKRYIMLNFASIVRLTLRLVWLSGKPWNQNVNETEILISASEK